MSERDGPVYFWKPEQENGFLGQWYPSRIVATNEDGSQIVYENAEQYMMHSKGLLFAPQSNTTDKILRATHPRDMKALGRKIPNFDEDVWREKRYEIVVQGNYLKFMQNEELKSQLLATGDRELVEASPLDRIWGVGFSSKNAGRQRAKWGLNLLGKALMKVRDRIKQESEDKTEVVVAPQNTSVQVDVEAKA